MEGKKPGPVKSPFDVHLSDMDLSKAELTILSEICLKSTQTMDVEEILSLTIDTYIHDLGMTVAMVYLQDLETGRYSLQDSFGLSEAQRKEIETRRRAGHDITQEVIKTGREVFIPDMSVDPRFKGIWDHLDSRSYLKLPLISRGTVVGVLGILAPPNQSITPRSVKFLKVIGHVFGIAIDNTLLRACTIRDEKRAQPLYHLGLEVSSSLSLNDVLESVAENSRQFMDADISVVELMDEGNQEMVMQAVSGRCNPSFPRFRQISRDHPPWKGLKMGRPIISHQGRPQSPQLYKNQFLAEEGVHSYLAVPLMKGMTLLGLLVLMYRDPRRFTHGEVNRVLRLTHQIVLAIENAQLYRRLHRMATLEERDRLARELHDDLSQTLGYLKVKASITEDLLEQGHIPKAKESLQELKKASENLYTNVREEIFNLRTQNQEQQGFFDTLQEYLAKYRTHYGLQVELMIEKERLQEVSQHVSIQLMRIIQEALSNVRKHADASEVRLSFSKEGGQMCVLIEDNGQGFTESMMEERGSENFGMQIMRERAESIGGRLQLDSEPGRGTRVAVHVPTNITERGETDDDAHLTRR